MSASLVGSEMCIRDSPPPPPGSARPLRWPAQRPPRQLSRRGTAPPAASARGTGRSRTLQLRGRASRSTTDRLQVGPTCRGPSGRERTWSVPTLSARDGHGSTVASGIAGVATRRSTRPTPKPRPRRRSSQLP
eukprot:9355626-Alexandrium_andersonii.AAC.1